MTARNGVRHPHFTLDVEEHEYDDVNETEARTLAAQAERDNPVDEDRNGSSTYERDRATGQAKAEELKEKGTYPPATSPQLQSPPLAHSSKTVARKPFYAGWFDPLPRWLAWIPPHLNWKGIRPVVRASIAAWCGLLLLLIPSSQRMLGQASFLCLVVTVISPAAYPIATMLETTFFQFLLVASSWAWACITIAIAHAVRTEFKFSQSQFQQYAAQKLANSGLTGAALTNAIQEDLYHGAYTEAASSVVCAVMFGVAAGFLLWLRGYLGPGPILFGVIFGLILQAITVTIAALIPYANYSLGLVFFLPFTCQQAIQLACTVFIIPETLAHQFADRMIAVLVPLKAAVQQQQDMLDTDPRTQDWLKHKSLRELTTKAVGGLALLSASEHNLTREVTYARISGRDFARLLTNVRLLVSRTSGFVRFYEIVEQHLHRGESEGKGGPVADDLVVRLGRSRHASVDNTPASTRPPSPTRPSKRPERTSSGADPAELSRALESASSTIRPALSTGNTSATPQRAQTTTAISRNASSSSLTEGNVDDPRRVSLDFDPHRHQSHHGWYHRRRPRSRHRNPREASHISLPSLLQDVLHANVEVPRPVGLVESMRYADLEDQLANPQDEQHIQEIVALLKIASSDLIDTLGESVEHLIAAIHRLKETDGIWSNLFRRYDAAAHKAACQATHQQLQRLTEAINMYRDEERLKVIAPFHRLFDPIGAEAANHDMDTVHEFGAPSHRGLFWVLSYQFSLLGWGDALLDVFKEVAKIEEKRTRLRIWTPKWAKVQFGNPDENAPFEEENPDMLSRLDPKAFVAARNPDYRPPQTRSQIIGIWAYDALHFFTRKDFLFATKVAIILALVSMPAYFPTTAWFFYRERGVWVIIMVALSSTQYVGDTVYAFVVRVFGTIAGGALGLLIWTIAAQNGRGNPYALGAVMAVALPFIMFFRVHYTPPIEAILPTVTIMLVVGYSWQNAQMPRIGSIGYGWDVAWRRMVCVLIGISIAFVGAYLPPKVTQKGTIRKTYAKVALQLGGVVCQVLSFALCKENRVTRPPKSVVKRITALRVKIGKTTARKQMVRFERSLRGPWPAEHYAAIQTLETEILELLGLFTAVLASLDAKWTKALLQRTQLANSDFVGSVCFAFQTIGLCLEHGVPVPMIYNPLLERFLRAPETLELHRPYGYDVVLCPTEGLQDHDPDHAHGDQDLSGLPTHVDLATLSSLEYLRFSTGVSIAYALWNRVDRLMFVTKSLVGESYLVYGLDKTRRRDWAWSAAGGGRLSASRTRDDSERRGLLGLDDSARPSLDTPTPERMV
ncbi:hypothetical protein OIV83_003568 [Microbotryomycetes sp. JL201]|nr:hypothetical protein OIV83_003568 [Microbotryomycetes sp. JL201]